MRNKLFKTISITTLSLGIALGNLVSCGIQGEQGIQVDKGEDGKDGISITSILKTSSDGNVDTYTITYSDGSISTFNITNGIDGSQGIQGQPGKDGHTPIITIGSNGNWFIDGVDSNVSAKGTKGDTGDKGEDGKDGISIVKTYINENGELICEMSDGIIVNAGLVKNTNKYTVTFDSDGCTEIESKEIEEGKKISKPEDPTKEGYTFEGWYCNDERWNFSGFSVTEDIILTAKWKENYTDGLAFYLLNDDTYGVGGGYAKYLENIVIPSYYNGKKVSTIVDHGFDSCTNIKEVTLPNTLTTIEEYAFNNCKNLQIKIPSSVENIGKYAFYYISNLTIENESEWIESLNSKSSFTYTYKYYASNSGYPDKTKTKSYFDDFSLSECLTHQVTVTTDEYAEILCTKNKTKIFKGYEYNIYNLGNRISY